MEIINQEVNTPKEHEKKVWHKPKLYWGKEIGFMPLLQTPGGPPGDTYIS